MKSTNQRIAHLRQLLDLEERRANLQSQLDTLTQQMHSLRDGLFDETSGSASAPSAGTSSSPTRGRRGRPPKATAGAGPVPSAPARGRKTRMKRGALKEQIYSALQAAGQAGVRVTELAKAFAIKPVNIHSWFHSAVRRHPEIRKIQGGHYRLEGGSASNSSLGSQKPATSGVKRGRGRPARGTSAATAKAKPAKSGGRAPRGQLTSNILSALESAGAKGITVKDLSEKVGAPYKNIYIWFATTGKKNAKVKKVGPAHYKLG